MVNKETKLFHIKLKDGEVIRVRADTIHEPTQRDPTYKLELNSQEVGKFRSEAVDGWWTSSLGKQ